MFRLMLLAILSTIPSTILGTMLASANGLCLFCGIAV